VLSGLWSHLSLEQVDAPSSTRRSAATPAQRLLNETWAVLQRAVRDEATRDDAGQGEERQGDEVACVDAAVAASLHVPTKWDKFGDLVLLPPDAYTASPWRAVDPPMLWATVAAAIGAKRVARKAEIHPGPKRKSQVVLLYPAEGDGWVTHTEGGTKYTWDVTQSMFCRGNVNERQRLPGLIQQGEVVVDLYAGIGYFTVPVLRTHRVHHLYACEWNPPSVVALRRNLENNGVQDRCTVLPGDNQASRPHIENKADRVLLGLLPSSETGWGLGVDCLKPRGGWLHVHENLPEGEEEAKAAAIVGAIADYAARHGKQWRVSLARIVHVKTYAPHVAHVVLDISCIQQAAE